MCLIAVKESNQEFPKDEYLVEANRRNPDGIGISYWKASQMEVAIKKDFNNIEHFLKWSKDTIKKEDICVIHFRLATHGLKDAGNRHPFPITKNKELLRKTELVCQFAVAHNGVIREYQSHKKFSDTQKFVMDILAEDSIKNNLKDRAVIKLINNFIDGDKLAILDKEGTLYYFGEYNEHEGIKYSNLSWQKIETKLTEYKGLYGKHYWEKLYGKYHDDPAGKTANDVPFVGECDACTEKKSLMEMEIQGTLYYLCKSCRKKHRKNKLDLALVIEDREYEEQEAELVEERICDVCGIMHKIAELSYIEGLAVCSSCKIRFEKV